jgi:hypothetical protein
MIVLFLNHATNNCGVYQYGKRLFDIIVKDDQITYVYREITNENEYIVVCGLENIGAIIYNYHQSTMNWLQTGNIQKTVTNIGVVHESPEYLFDIVCNLDPSMPSDVTHYSIPRPIYENVDDLPAPTGTAREFILAHTDGHIPIFGSFGFGFRNKGFHHIVTMINDNYDSAIIKFVIPVAHFDPDSQTVNHMRTLCINANRKPGIVLMIHHEFLSNDDILSFLKSNTMNIFLYDDLHGRGISSAVDYAISVKKPVGVSNSHMFRNIYSDSICLNKVSISDCMNNSVTYCDQFVKQYSHINMIQKFRDILKL